MLCEISEAVAQLRAQELANLKSSLQAQRIQVDLLEETVKRMQSKAKFGDAVLEEVVAEIEKKEETLKRRIERLQDSATRGTMEQVDLAQEQLRLRRQQLRRLSAYEEVWQRRQQNFLNLASPEDIRSWKAAAKAALETLFEEVEFAQLEISDLESQLSQVQDQLEDSAENGPERGRLMTKAAKRWRRLLESQQRELSSIQAAGELQTKLLRELDTGSLVTSAQEKLYAVKRRDCWRFGIKSWP